MLYTEARLGSLIAIGKGDVPEAHWYRDGPHLPAGVHLAEPAAAGAAARRRSAATSMTGGWYEWKGLRYVPSWGGSMFEALMPTLVPRRARARARGASARNDEVHVEVQRRFAAEELGYPVWGMSPARVARARTATASTACSPSACAATTTRR